MELTIIRDRILNRLRDVNLINSSTIDEEINMVQRQYIQPVARLPGVAEYTTTKFDETVDKNTIAEDIYRFNIVTLTNTREEVRILLLDDYHIDGKGVRPVGNQVYFQNMKEGQELRFYYFKRLRDLGEGEDQIQVPDIEDQWHDLYVMGVLATWLPDYYPMFREQLESFRKDRMEETRHGTSPIPIKGWW